MATSVSQPKRTVHRSMVKIKGDSFYDRNYDVVERESLNFFEPEDNSNKFYIAEVHKGSHGDFRLYINYGRVGRDGVENAQKFDTLTSVKSAFDKKVASKVKKGYTKVDLATFTRGSSQGQSQVNIDSVGVNVKDIRLNSSKLDKKVQELITHIYAEANQAVSVSMTGNIKADVKAPLGNLGIGGIKKARFLLDDISYYAKEGDISKVRDLSIIYYRNVPRKMPSDIRDERTWILNTPDRIRKEFETLDLYEDTLRLLPAMGTSDIDAKYDALACDIKVVDDETLAYIIKKIDESYAPNHNFKAKVVNAFEVNQKNAPRFDDSCGNVRRLFHGTRSANLVGILSSHLKLPTSLKGVHITGAMFGNGIYFASESTKSLNYSMGTFGGQRNKYPTVFLFICDVALGNVKKEFSATPYNKAPNGYHSVMGVGGRTLQNMIKRGEVPSTSRTSLINNEFIIYNQSRQRIKYVVEVEIVR